MKLQYLQLNKQHICRDFHQLPRQLLQALPEPTLLKILKLGFTLYNPSNANGSKVAVSAFPWRELAEILVTSSFQSLKEVHIELGKLTFGYKSLDTTFYAELIIIEGFHLLQENGIKITVHKVDCQQWMVSNEVLFSGLDQKVWCDPEARFMHSAYSYPLSTLILTPHYRVDLKVLSESLVQSQWSQEQY